MSEPASRPSVAFLSEAMRVDHDTGFLYWRERPRHHFLTELHWVRFNSSKAGQRADVGRYSSNGYRRVRMNYRSRRIAITAHRVVFAIVYGQWPQHEIDHINRDRTDNRPANLRDVTHAVNCQNFQGRHQRCGAASPSSLPHSHSAAARPVRSFTTDEDHHR